ncbi:hypothetical protein SAY86_011645 [Trapa natans]|uniref:Alpha 1,4-glycosyltransferase domain-containing protein n=1 Tax=Trapa natans TaxID=22666 RepID=A0AAN7LJA1_TRANT|nr:hypothetical protein SAY86_011645 [Trapa natans]
MSSTDDKSSKVTPVGDPTTGFFILLFRSAFNVKEGAVDALHRLPTSALALLLLFLLTFNGLSIFSVRVSPPLAMISSDMIRPSTEAMHVVRADDPLPVVMTHTRLPVHLKGESPSLPGRNLSFYRSKSARRRRRFSRKITPLPTFPAAQAKGRFSARMKGFLGNSSCKGKFFMTWISSLDSFGDREAFAVESLFSSHPAACLVIVSHSMDSTEGTQMLRPFTEKGFKATAISPDFAYLFKNTPAQLWFSRLVKGSVDPGEVPLGQNLSNLLRLSLLYKYGGVYLDTDVVVLRSLTQLRNVIGAQTVDGRTGNWSRLNNAVLAFDKGHPLLYKFIEEFALTFDGSKWGHNGPYLVSRVVGRVNRRDGLNFTVVPPPAFYPVDWSRVQSLFKGPRGQLHSKWLLDKYRHISRESYAVHLWNRQSRRMRIEKDSVMDRILWEHCVFCTRKVEESL